MRRVNREWRRQTPGDDDAWIYPVVSGRQTTSPLVHVGKSLSRAPRTSNGDQAYLVRGLTQDNLLLARSKSCATDGIGVILDEGSTSQPGTA